LVVVLGDDGVASRHTVEVRPVDVRGWIRFFVLSGNAADEHAFQWRSLQDGHGDRDE
jgi:hypothetical protein